MSDDNQLFLRILDLMTGPAAIADGYKWVIKSIDLLPEGPCAIFYFDWRSSKLHDAFACMSVRMENGKPVLRAETGTVGRLTAESTQALFNRFHRALFTVKS